jgi:uncharacterized membrane protein YeaQ/YmgE (transglycosylase-associated protein family)
MGVVLIGATVGMLILPLVGRNDRGAGLVLGALLGVTGATLGAFFGRASASASSPSSAVVTVAAIVGASLVVLGYARFRSHRFGK